ncbi:haloacid dehalogenase [Marmoricola endophyticus]|uniref:Haloacid dehalogenase n=1 Tax=Marmoricola endophyticus TaxID=2040280 RepID=A0A917F3L0_9ACTN|nr:HAD family hydrolase [Marmoricola endophyticus]GGF49784.1 haloacid dehalogenase [Marmoricola endophyticus]
MRFSLSGVDTVVLDVDGTLVDTVYHHVRTWGDAFDAVGVAVPSWRIHRAIGMGGDRLVAAVAGDEVETSYGDEVRSRHDEAFWALLDRVQPLPGAADLLRGLGDLGLRVVVASSGSAEQTRRLLATVEGNDRSDAVAANDDAEASKPDSQIVDVAVARVEGRKALVVGDAVYDMQAARRGGHRAVGVLTGGFGAQELLDAGADAVFETAVQLLAAVQNEARTGS